MKIHGFEIPDYRVSEEDDEGLEEPIKLILRDPEEPSDVIGGESGTYIELSIKPDGIHTIRYDNDYGAMIDQKVVPWSEILPLYGQIQSDSL